MEQLEKIIHEAWLAVVTGAIGSCWWLIRTVFTNNKQIELLQQQIKSTNELAAQQRHADEKRMDRMGDALMSLSETQGKVAPAVEKQNEILIKILEKAK